MSQNQIIELIDNFRIKNKKDWDFIEKLCGVGLKIVAHFLTRKQNENLLNDDDFIFVEDFCRNEESNKDFLVYLSEILINKLNSDDKMINYLETYKSLLNQKQVDSNELAINNNRIVALIKERDDSPKPDLNKIVDELIKKHADDLTDSIGNMNDQFVDELFNKMKKAEEINEKMLKIVNHTNVKTASHEEILEKLKLIEQLIDKQKLIFLDGVFLSDEQN